MTRKISLFFILIVIIKIFTACRSNQNVETKDLSKEMIENTTQATNNLNENEDYSYEQLESWFDKAEKLMPDVNNGLAEMYIDEDKNVLVVGIIDESYREVMEQKLKDINGEDVWYEIIISEMPKSD